MRFNLRCFVSYMSNIYLSFNFILLIISNGDGFPFSPKVCCIYHKKCVYVTYKCNV